MFRNSTPHHKQGHHAHTHACGAPPGMPSSSEVKRWYEPANSRTCPQAGRQAGRETGRQGGRRAGGREAGRQAGTPDATSGPITWATECTLSSAPCKCPCQHILSMHAQWCPECCACLAAGQKSAPPPPESDLVKSCSTSPAICPLLHDTAKTGNFMIMKL